MRRFFRILVLAALLAACLPTVSVAVGVQPAETRGVSVWQALMDLLEPIFGANEGDGSPEWDPNGAQAPPPVGGAEQGTPGGSGNTDGSPEADPNG